MNEQEKEAIATLSVADKIQFCVEICIAFSHSKGNTTESIVNHIKRIKMEK